MIDKPVDALVIVSDFHLAPLHTPAFVTAGEAKDRTFAALLENIIRRSRQDEASWRLVLLGDVFDILHAGFDAPDPRDTSEQASLANFERIAKAHPSVFAALGEFIRAGLSLAVCPGNHDADLVRPAVQARFKELLCEHASNRQVEMAVDFFPWIYYLPGLLYAEHGHLHHDLNNVPTLLQSFSTSRAGQLDLPPGAQLEIYLYGQIQRLDPDARDIDQPIAYLITAYRHNPLLLLKTLPGHIRFLWESLKFLATLDSPKTKSRRANYHQEVLVPYAQSLGLAPDAVIAIDRLAHATPLRILRRLARLSANRRGSKSTREGYLYLAAQSIHAILSDAGQATPFYVFGHTHAPTIIPLDDISGHKAKYINTGTWVEEDEDGFPYIEITRSGQADRPAAVLRYWKQTAPLDAATPIRR